ncbi:MAG: lipopolysaccharide biosynthesis protein [Clostridiales bacterium]|nr:lipopolysaccharide biosynthesis protein [Clostridiales bacterium]
MAKVSSKTIYSSLLWNFLERILVEGIQLIISIVLARILLPEDYGILSLIVVFVSIATVFVETGFCSALIHKKEIDNNDINFIFTVNIIISILMCAILFFTAPLIANFYKNYNANELIRMLRGYSLILPIGAISSVQTALVHRKMMFKNMLVVNSIATITSGAVGIILALNGFGTWALILQQISFKVITVLILAFIVKWLPKVCFGKKESWGMIKYGSNILWVRLFNTFYNKLSALVVGKRYSPETLAFYEKGQTFPSLIATNTDYSLQKVMFSAYSKEQDNLPRIKELMRQTISLITFILFPLIMGMFAVTKNLISCLLTDKWLDATIYMQLFCLFYLLQPIKTTSAQALNGIGKSNVSFRIAIFSKLLGIVLIFSTIWFGLVWMLIGLIFTEVVACLLYFILNKKYFSYGIREQVIDILPTIVTSTIMVVAVILFTKLVTGLNKYLLLGLQVLIGFIVYAIFAFIIDKKKVRLIKDFFKNKKTEESDK